MSANPFAVSEDGSAINVSAYRQAVLADPMRRERLAEDMETLRIVTSGSDEDFQNLLRRAHAAYKTYREGLVKQRSERTMEAQRASAPVPRDTVQVYKELKEAGLEYGPAFRLLRNVHVADKPKDW